MKKIGLVLLLVCAAAFFKTQSADAFLWQSDSSLFRVSVHLLIPESGKAPTTGTIVINPATIQDKQSFQCEHDFETGHYSVSISRNGPADKTNSFFFAVWHRDLNNPEKTYTLWRGYLPEPEHVYAFTEIITPTLIIAVTTYMPENEKGLKNIEEYLNKELKRATFAFKCYFENP
ncbi:MAG: hypothetical protein Q7R73_01550 [bacterium]|nr:hypothetical protein [bacterium]